MEPEKVLKLLTENLGDWSRITLLTLIRPISRFELVLVGDTTGVSEIVGVRTEKQLWLNPRLLIFSVLSIILGLSLNALIPNRTHAPDLLSSVLIVFLYWVVCGSLLYLVCRLIGGKGGYLETLSVTLQVLATLYVVSSFFALLLSSLTSIPVLEREFGTESALVGVLDSAPVVVFFVVDTILIAIYVPLALKTVHKFGWGRTSLVLILLLIGGPWVPIAVYKTFGLFLGGMIVA